MAKTIIPYFGEVDTDHPAESYPAKVGSGAGEILLDLNFLHGSVTDDWLTPLNHILADLPGFERKARQTIQEDFKEGGEAKEYAVFHLEEVDDMRDQIMALLEDSSKSDEERVIDALRLRRIGFYPGERTFAVWDFHIAVELTDQLLVVNLNAEGEPEYLRRES